MTGPRDHLNGSFGHSRFDTGIGNSFRKSQIGMDRFGAAAENDCVSGFQAKPCCVDRHIGAGFIDDRNDADRDGDFFNIKSVGTPEAVQPASDGIGEGDNVPQTVGNPFDPFFIQPEPVEHCRSKSGSFGIFHVGPVRLHDELRFGVHGVGHGGQPAVFILRRGDGEFPGGCFCHASHLFERFPDLSGRAILFHPYELHDLFSVYSACYNIIRFRGFSKKIC